MSNAIRRTKAHRFARLGVVLSVVFSFSAFGMALSSAAPGDPDCNGVFPGATPRDPILKTADVSEAYPGGSVTYTIEWTSTGADTADVTDCFRVDDGSDGDLNAIVETLNYTDERENVGGADQAQSWSVTVQIPNDDSLIGHSVVNRVKITHGSVESRSDLVSVAIIEPPCTENCEPTDDGQSDDGSTDGEPTDDGSTDGEPTDDGSTDDGSTDGTVVEGDTIVKPKTVVLGEQLAQTGPETTMLMIIGLAFLMLGAAMRFGRFGGPILATNGRNAQDLVAEALRRRARGWTCKG